MDKKHLIVVSICAVIFLFLGSLSNVVGFYTVQSSNQQTIKEEFNQRDLLFQTIVDIVNNKEIQRIILKSQMNRGIFPVSESPVLTMNQIRQMYFIGMIQSKFISKSRIQSMVQKYQLFNPDLQQKISAVIEKDATINSEISQLQNSECACENENIMNWSFPIICEILMFFGKIGLIFIIFGGFISNSIGLIILNIIIPLLIIFNCT